MKGATCGTGYWTGSRLLPIRKQTKSALSGRGGYVWNRVSIPMGTGSDVKSKVSMCGSWQSPTHTELGGATGGKRFQLRPPYVCRAWRSRL